jgi:hypothetical protein
MVHQFKIVVEKNPDGYVAYPLGLKGVLVGQGDTTKKSCLMYSQPSGFILKPLALKS